MSRRLTPYLFAGVLGVISGVYIFRPVFEEAVAAKEIRGITESVKFPVSDTQHPSPPKAK
ncbi:hypothetical protein BS17DRAFT_778518 [Gyrodon lividus]|nr:hypothetical protein BS17DRAFT_778518 [Gyrodon lividus]